MENATVKQFCEAKLQETMKDTYPSYQEFRMAEVDLWTEKRMALAILELIKD